MGLGPDRNGLLFDRSVNDLLDFGKLRDDEQQVDNASEEGDSEVDPLQMVQVVTVTSFED